MTILLDGRELSQKLQADTSASVMALRELGVQPHLAVVLVGDDPASVRYVEMKARACARAGIKGTIIRLPAHIHEQVLIERIRLLNDNMSVHGILVQHPLPPHIDEHNVCEAIAPQKDVDGVTTTSLGKLVARESGFVPCTALGIITLLDAYNIRIASKYCVVIGRSLIVGFPTSWMLQDRDGTVSTCHSKTPRDMLRENIFCADILVVAVGKPGFVTGSMIKRDAVVIDAGYNRAPNSTGNVGDVDFASACGRASYLTPVPGGVGPMTIAMLLKQTVAAARTTLAAEAIAA